MDTAKLLSSVPTGLWIGGEEREGKSTFNVLDPSDDQVLTAVADATAGRRHRRARRRVRRAGRVGGHRARANAARSCASVFEKITERADDIATLMTLEMGKVVAGEHGRSQVRRRVLPLVRRGGGAHRRPVHPEPGGQRPHHRHQAGGRPVLRDHAVELPAGDGHPQDRPGAGGGLHDDRQAGAGDAADHAAAGQADGRGGPAEGCAVGAADQ